jgi:cell division septation protein DedD
MTGGKKTYYQVSFTSGQALAAVIVVILALGLSFFFGARAGFERSGETESPSPARQVQPRPVPAPLAVDQTASTSPGTASATGPGLASATSEEAPVFEDREAGVTEEKKGTGSKTPSAPSRTEIGGSSAAPEPTPRKTAPGSAPPATSSREPSNTSEKPGFFVQIISTASKAEAARWKEKLAGKNYRTATVTSVDSKKGKLFRVRTGPYPDRAQAKKVAAKISADFKQKAWVTAE